MMNSCTSSWLAVPGAARPDPTRAVASVSGPTRPARTLSKNQTFQEMRSPNVGLIKRFIRDRPLFGICGFVRPQRYCAFIVISFIKSSVNFDCYCDSSCQTIYEYVGTRRHVWCKGGRVAFSDVYECRCREGTQCVGISITRRHLLCDSLWFVFSQCCRFLQ